MEGALRSGLRAAARSPARPPEPVTGRGGRAVPTILMSRRGRAVNFMRRPTKVMLAERCSSGAPGARTPAFSMSEPFRWSEALQA